MSIRLGINPISWFNSDIPSIARQITVEECLAETALIGYQGVELGDPMRQSLHTLPTMLSDRHLQMIGGWHPTFVLQNNKKKEIERLQKQLDILYTMGGSLITVTECTGAINKETNSPLSTRPHLNESQWDLLCNRLESLAEYTKRQGFNISYHPRLGTAIQSQEDIELLLNNTEKLGLLLDTGHLTYANVNILYLVERYISRINHVYLKNIRNSILQSKQREDSSFIEMVLSGVFTFPGDDGPNNKNGIHFFPLIDALVRRNYNGWLIMLAEQDPTLADPFTYARLGYYTINAMIYKALLRNSPEQPFDIPNANANELFNFYVAK